MSRRARVLPLITAALLCGCVGAIDRPDFDAEVQQRGGGLTSTFVDDSLAVVAAEVGAASGADLEVVTLVIQPARRVVVAQARRGDRPDFVDVVTTRDGEVVAVAPVQDADELPLDELTVRVGDLPLDGIEAVGDLALVEFAEAGGFVDAIRVSLISGTHIVDIDVESSRRTATFRYELDGTPLGEQ